MSLLPLRVRRPAVPVDMSRDGLDRIRSLGHACTKTAEAAGSQDKSVVADLGDQLDSATWSRIKSDQATPKWEVLDALMDACGNELALFWMLHKRGYDPRSLRRYETDLERENRELREQLDRANAERLTERRLLADVMRESRAA